MNRLLFLLAFSTCLLMAGCAKKPLLYTSDTVMDEFEPTYLDFEFLSARGKVMIEDQSGRVTKGTLNIRAQKDSVVWFSLSPGLGIEAARGIMTTDYIKIRDRINGNTIDMDYATFETRYGVALTLSLIQNLLFANIPHEYTFRDRMVRVGQVFELTQERDNLVYRSTISAKHGKVTDLQSGTKRKDGGSLSANYLDFKDVDSQPFPYKAIVNMVLSLPDKPRSKMSMNAEIVKVDLTNAPLSFPYNY
ncbi:hypothetical protein ADIS_0935 [Lunatimonas lonarensis]|uniref:DUF4292 domain-containing protein n=1 Tax=Lunatimonas lonarensis TaxID=1232681 RepID=R7ZWS4_9BACT|nr:DUF4292 domain-containing protein [Lunatimonas lonarensis]EON78585.1 hypothetical protein ADIS_0935 [Lunatimonas lonarensis]